jgi:hypothetical protein
VPPLKLLPAFCKAVDSLEPLKALSWPLGAEVIDETDQLLLEMARAQVAKLEAAKRERRLAEKYKESKR